MDPNELASQALNCPSGFQVNNQLRFHTTQGRTPTEITPENCTRHVQVVYAKLLEFDYDRAHGLVF